MALVLHGYRYSVYLRIVRLTLAEKGVAYDRVEVNPFASDVPAAYLALHPFGRVPTLVHDGFVLYETGAITRYIDRAFPGPPLQPGDARALARMENSSGVRRVSTSPSNMTLSSSLCVVIVTASTLSIERASSFCQRPRSIETVSLNTSPGVRCRRT